MSLNNKLLISNNAHWEGKNNDLSSERKSVTSNYLSQDNFPYSLYIKISTTQTKKFHKKAARSLQIPTHLPFRPCPTPSYPHPSLLPLPTLCPYPRPHPTLSTQGIIWLFEKIVSYIFLKLCNSLTWHDSFSYNACIMGWIASPKKICWSPSLLRMWGHWNRVAADVIS